MAQNLTFSDPQIPPDYDRTGRVKAKSARQVDALRKNAFVGGAHGLQLLVYPTKRSWRLYYRLPGDRQRRAMHLGDYPDVSLAEARQAAKTARVRARAGDDPKEALHRHVQSAVSVDEALDEYLGYCDGENAPRTVVEKCIAFRVHIRPSLGKSTLRNLGSGDWMRAIDRLGRRAGARRNLYAYIRRFLSWAAERQYISANPLLGVKAPRKVASRARVLSEDEIRSLWTVESVTADLARLALLTAQRETSLGALRWDQVNLDKRLWTIPAALMKSNKEHAVPLSDLAVEILRGQIRMSGDYVFGVNSAGEKAFNGFSNGMDSLRKELAGETSLQGQRVSETLKNTRREAALERKATQWRFHDLRRTAVTMAQAAGQPLDAIRALTQHKIGGVLGTYARHTYDKEMRDVVAAIEIKVREILL